MDFRSLYQLKDKQLKWMDPVFYAAFGLLLIAIFCYLLFTVKIYVQHQKISKLEEKMLAYGTEQEKANEKKVLDYKRKIEEFNILVDNHKISSNIFSFIEQKTLPKVWFSSFDVSEVQNKVRLSGESENMEILSHQVHIFEDSKDYINAVDVLNSQVSGNGKTTFTLELSLHPALFSYYPNGFVGFYQAPSSEQTDVGESPLSSSDISN